MRRWMIVVATGAVALAAALAVVLLLTGGPASGPPAGIEVAGADIGGRFELTDQDGRRVASEELIDGPTLLYFGYTFCPDVCPVDAAIIAEATDLLAERGIEVTPVFITVDPARDTPAALRDFVGAMHPRMVGLTGTPEEIEQAAKAYKVYYAKAGEPEATQDYTMNHTTFTYLMTPDGLAGLFRRGITAREMADEAEQALSG